MSNPVPTAPIWGLGGGGRPVVTSPMAYQPGGALEVSGLSLSIPLPEELPIPDAREFNPTGSIASAGLQNNILITGTTTQVPDGTFGVIRSVQLFINDMLPTTDVIWSLIINQASPQGFNQITMFPRLAPFVGNTIPACIRFQGPATITMIFSNRDGGAYLVGGGYGGWFWPEASDARWRRYGY